MFGAALDKRTYSNSVPKLETGELLCVIEKYLQLQTWISNNYLFTVDGKPCPAHTIFEFSAAGFAAALMGYWSKVTLHHAFIGCSSAALFKEISNSLQFCHLSHMESQIKSLAKENFNSFCGYPTSVVEISKCVPS
jgi:hypothetical protein